MRIQVICAALALASCTEAQRQRIGEYQRQQQQQQYATQQEASRLIIVPGDINQKYTIVGSVAAPPPIPAGGGEGTSRVHIQTPYGERAYLCNEEVFRTWMAQQYGDRVDAVIGFTIRIENGNPLCRGTAVRFVDRPTTTSASGGDSLECQLTPGECRSLDLPFAHQH